jgi:hypothetical protein
LDEEWKQFITNNINKNDTYCIMQKTRCVTNSTKRLLAEERSSGDKMRDVSGQSTDTSKRRDTGGLCPDASYQIRKKQSSGLDESQQSKVVTHQNHDLVDSVRDERGFVQNTCQLLTEDRSSVKYTQNSTGHDTRSDDDEIPTANDVPKCEDLYISTKTKVLFLNHEIDIHRIFWEIPIIEYWRQEEGIIKKQMKIVSKTPEEYEEYREKIKGSYYYSENIIKQIHNPNARRIKFKDERKITIGISKKDILNSRIKVKNAFYNCFAIIFRFLYDGQFREIHVKIFNTGKLEIPGILNVQILDIVKRMILDLLIPYIGGDIKLDFVENKVNENVLINSNFNCGYFINREKLHSILKGPKYGIEASYDPCSYPGVKCKFYYNNELSNDNIEKQNGRIMQEDRNMKMYELGDNKKYTEVSFMIFRTGSCLIVGNCSEQILNFIYQFIRNMFQQEYSAISIKSEDLIVKNKNGKTRKRTINVSNDYYQKIVG